MAKPVYIFHSHRFCPEAGSPKPITPVSAPRRDSTRRAFAGDLANLVLAAPRVNRYEKRAKDAAEWLPAQDRCWFAGQVVLVRAKYGLTVDRRERAALEKILTDCQWTD